MTFDAVGGDYFFRNIFEGKCLAELKTGYKSPIYANTGRTLISASVSGYLAVLLAAACWGTSGIFASFILDGHAFSSLSLAFWRDLVTFLTLFTGL